MQQHARDTVSRFRPPTTEQNSIGVDFARDAERLLRFENGSFEKRMQLLTAEHSETVRMCEVGDNHVGQSFTKPPEIQPSALILKIHNN